MVQWKKIPELPDYEVSDQGRVRSVDRVVVRRTKQGNILQPLCGKILRPVRCKNGYLYVNIRGRSYQVHRLVAIAWVPGYDPRLDAAHKDNNRTNNVYTNLAWKTRKENLDDQIAHGTRLRGETQNGAKLTADEVREMRRLRSIGMSWRKVGDQFGVAPTTAKNAIVGNTWAHVA